MNNKAKKAGDEIKKVNDDHHANTLNPNSEAYKAAQDNRALQIQKHKESEKQKGK